MYRLEFQKKYQVGRTKEGSESKVTSYRSETQTKMPDIHSHTILTVSYPNRKTESMEKLQDKYPSQKVPELTQ